MFRHRRRSGVDQVLRGQRRGESMAFCGWIEWPRAVFRPREVPNMPIVLSVVHISTPDWRYLLTITLHCIPAPDSAWRSSLLDSLGHLASLNKQIHLSTTNDR